MSTICQTTWNMDRQQTRLGRSCQEINNQVMMWSRNA